MNTIGKKKISLFSAIMFGIALLLPIAPVPVYAQIQPLTQGHMALSYFAAAIPMTMVAFAFGRLGSEFPRAGSSYTFVSESIHPTLGTLTGWAILMDYGLFPLLNYVCLGIYVCALFPGLNMTAVILVSIVVIGFINLMGIKSIATVGNILTIFGCFVAIYFIVKGIGAFSDPTSGIEFSLVGLYNPETFSWQLLLTGASIACFSFLGFDAITTLAEDLKNPRRNLPLSMILVCVIMCADFVILSWMAQCAYPSFEYTNPDAGFLDAAVVVGGQLMYDLISIAFIAGAFAYSLDMMAGVCRLLYGMGRDNVLPKKFFGHVDKKGTPVYNVILVTVFCLCFSWMELGDLMPMINFGGLSAFTLVCVGCVKHFFFDKKERNTFGQVLKSLILPGLGAITCFVLWISLPAKAKIVGFSWLAVGLIYIAIKTKGFKQKLVLHGDMEETPEVEAEKAEA